ncbi:MAG: gliding motility-associated C-terminal domain-containing protein [Vicingaceae bacterium]|nr:gliding motility-associated C-terminal domain-containing protein [Vicingaceae bacterium]
MKDGLENIDEVFKQAFDGFEANVDPSIWSNIQNGINAGSTGGSPQADPVSSVATNTVAKSVVVKIAAAVIAVGTIATATYYIATSPKDEVIVENVVDNTENNVIVEEQIERDEPIVSEVENENIEVIENNTPVEEEVIKENTTPIVEKEDIINENNSTQSNTNEIVSNTNETKEAPVSQDEQVTTTNTQNETNSTPKVEKEVPVKDQPKEVVEELNKEAQINTIPNVISPNGDGQNDVIKITGTNLEKLEVAIMDKTGKVVYRMKTIDEEWNGKDQNGFDLIPGTYYIAGVVIDTDGNIKNIKQAVNLFK